MTDSGPNDPLPSEPAGRETAFDGEPDRHHRPMEGGSMERGRSLPGLVVLGVLVAGALFAAGYTLGSEGERSGGSTGGSGGLDAIIEAYERISRDYVGASDPDELVQAAIGAMFDSLDDPYSSYMGADRFDTDLADISGEFEGIGARMTSEDAAGEACEPVSVSCRLRVVDVLAGSPAEHAGLVGGDVIQAIDGQPIDGLTMTDAVALIRGPSGTEVQLEVDRAGEDVDIAITRELIRAQDVTSALLADGKVGYLRVDTFSTGAADDFHARLRSHLDAGVADVIVDVRDDPGGFVDAAVTMASEFLADGPVYQEEHAGGERRVVEARAGGLATDPSIDVVVLIDDGTASASEILAGALGNRGRATLVGETTFGKGTIQEWTELPGDNGGFRLSVARWLLPDGSSIDRVGVRPDVEVAGPDDVSGLPRDEAALLEDPVIDAAVAVLLEDSGQPAASASPSAGPQGSSLPSPALRASSSSLPAAPAACAFGEVGLLFRQRKGGDVQ